MGLELNLTIDIYLKWTVYLKQLKQLIDKLLQLAENKGIYHVSLELEHPPPWTTAEWKLFNRGPPNISNA